MRHEFNLEVCKITWEGNACLENPMDRGTWRATVHGAAESDLTEHTRKLKKQQQQQQQLDKGLACSHDGNVLSPNNICI